MICLTPYEVIIALELVATIRASAAAENKKLGINFVFTKDQAMLIAKLEAERY